MYDEHSFDRYYEAVADRKARLRNRMKKLTAALGGYDRPLTPLTLTPAGRYSEKNTQALVDALARTVEGIRTRHGLAFAGEVETFYRSFFYCAIRLATGRPWIPYTPTGTFQDILDLADELYYSRPEELYAQELQPYFPERTDGFFGYGDTAWSTITRKEVDELLSPKERAAGEAELSRASEVSMQWYSGLEYEEEDLDLPGIDEPYDFSAEVDEWNEYCDRVDESQFAAFARFPQREVFCKAYEDCRRAWFASGLETKEAAYEVELAVSLYLAGTGSIPLLEDEKYFAAYGYLERTTRRLQKLVADGE